MALRTINLTQITPGIGAKHSRIIFRKLPLVRIYIGQGRLEAAEALATEVLDLSKELYGMENSTTVMCMTFVGMVFFQNNNIRAIKVLEQALALGQAVFELICRGYKQT